jgi:methylthioribose-1-phosphate isomerase
MFGKVVAGFCRRSSGLVVFVGAIGILAGLGYVLAARTPKADRSRSRNDPKLSRHRMKVTQTRSELGYVYWVVRETGENAKYALFDTWQEAMDEANRRMKAAAFSGLAPALNHA